MMERTVKIKGLGGSMSYRRMCLLGASKQGHWKDGGGKGTAVCQQRSFLWSHGLGVEVKAPGLGQGGCLGRC